MTAGRLIDQESALYVMKIVMEEFIALHGPLIILLEDVHTLDSWSWQLLLLVSAGNAVFYPYLSVILIFLESMIRWTIAAYLSVVDASILCSLA